MRSRPVNNARLTVLVVRSGGVAGIQREWRAAGTDDELATAVSACAWDQAPASPGSGRDGFSWIISVESDQPATVSLSEADIDGPWKSLVDLVKSRATRE
jgi:hypothetical protein